MSTKIVWERRGNMLYAEHSDRTATINLDCNTGDELARLKLYYEHFLLTGEYLPELLDA